MDRALRVTPRRGDDGTLHYEWRHAAARLAPSRGGWTYTSSRTSVFIPGEDEPSLQFSLRPIPSIVVALLQDPVIALPRTDVSLWISMPLELRVCVGGAPAEIDVIDGGIRRAAFDRPADGYILPAARADRLAHPAEAFLEDEPLAALQVRLKNRLDRTALVRRIPITGQVLRLFREGGFIAATHVTVTVLEPGRAEARTEAGRAPRGFRPVTVASTPEDPRARSKRPRPQWLEELTRRPIEYSL